MIFKKKTKPNRFGSDFHCAAIVAAAGSSTRMGTNKLMLDLDGIPVLARTLMSLEACDDIHEIVLVCRSDDIVVYADLATTYGITKLLKIVKGGAVRSESVEAGILNVSKDTTHVAVHDAARPLATPSLISRVVRLAASTNAAIPVVPVKDTIKQVEHGYITATPDRTLLYGAQTPQVFDIDLLKGALQNAKDAGISVTDDASAVEALGVTVYTVEGDYTNIKVTTPEDIAAATAILSGGY